MRNKRALSPLIATILLVVFSLVLGTVTMIWGSQIVDEGGPEDPVDEPIGASVIISTSSIDNQLKWLQIRYITNELTLDQYLEQQGPIIQELKND